jgi:hypothetical protein
MKDLVSSLDGAADKDSRRRRTKVEQLYDAHGLAGAVCMLRARYDAPKDAPKDESEAALRRRVDLKYLHEFKDSLQKARRSEKAKEKYYTTGWWARIPNEYTQRGKLNRKLAKLKRLAGNRGATPAERAAAAAAARLRANPAP